LLGVSQGGRIALRYATLRADRLRSLVVQGAAVDGFSVDAPDAERIPIDEFVALARAGDLDALRGRWSAHPMMSLAGASRENRELVRDIVADYEGRDLVAFDPAHYTWPRDVLADLEIFPRPTLLLTGARETEARKAHAAKLLSTLPDVRERVLAHSGHLSNLTEPDPWNETVRAFCLGAEPV
jgi:pimeloyl-ACP methyl ester carboxylesterase